MRIIIRHTGCLRKFVIVESSDRDGSLTFVLRREGTSSSNATWSTHPDRQEPSRLNFDKPRPKSKRVTIHQSGRVNYHGNNRSIFIEPLTLTSRTTWLYGYRVPSLEMLDQHLDTPDEQDNVFDLSDLGDGPVSFSVFIGPSSLIATGRFVKIAYDIEGYSVVIAVDNVPNPVSAAYAGYFTTMTPEKGLFLEQQMAEDQAMISYHQALAGTQGTVLYHPNGEGFIRMIFSAPMRIAPQFKIELLDPNLHVSEQDVTRDGRSERVMLKFKVRNRRTGQIIREPVAFESIDLDAEL